MTPSGIVTTLFAGAVGATWSPRQQCGVAEEVSFGSGPQTYHISIGIAGGERLLELPHYLSSLGLLENASGVAEEHHHRQDCWDKGCRVAGHRCRWGLARHVRFRGRCNINFWIARKDIHNARGRTHIEARFICFIVRSTTQFPV